MNVLSSWMIVTKIVTITMDRIHVPVTLASDLMKMNCIVMVMCIEREGIYCITIEIDFF